MAEIITLENSTLDNIPRFNVNGLQLCKVLHVVDGDTFRGAMSFNNRVYLFTFRCAGVNAAELHPRKSEPNRSSIILKAIEAKTYLQDKIQDKMVEVDVVGMDCFGRLLSDVSIDNVKINKQMLDLGLVVPFSS